VLAQVAGGVEAAHPDGAGWLALAAGGDAVAAAFAH
jgi:hypothetical protein